MLISPRVVVVGGSSLLGRSRGRLGLGLGLGFGGDERRGGRGPGFEARRPLGARACQEVEELLRGLGNSINFTSREKVPPTALFSEYTSLFPCWKQSVPPRIEHLVFLENGSVCELISDALKLPESYVAELIRFGAVYYSLVCPTPPYVLTPEHMALYKKVSLISRNKKRAAIKGKTIAEARKTFRITSVYEGIDAGTYVRVHVHPKRFPRCYETNWKSRIIKETDSYVVLDKPAGVPVGGSVDNVCECCATFTSHALNLHSPLRVTHQIDNCTEGCVVLAKTKEFASEFHRLLREKKVQKFYLALAAAPVLLGKVKHYMRPGHRHPRIISEVAQPGWAPCEMEILECKKVPWPSESIEAEYKIQNSGWAPQEFAYECKVQLLTGRTHQVRAQFAALGGPLVGDSMYIAATMCRNRCPEADPVLHASKDEEISSDALDKWSSEHGGEPECALGLQASHIIWDYGDTFYEAGKPWWRS